MLLFFVYNLNGKKNMKTLSVEAAIDVLTASGYLVIEQYVKLQQYHIDEACPKSIGIYLDVETTGLNVYSDQIIEIGLVIFEFSSDGRIFKILEEFNQYQDPKMSIPSNITEITGITNEMVKGMSIDKDQLLSYIAKADVIIAHNAAFDRGFIESFMPSIPIRLWACSMTDVRWGKEGIESSKLEYLAYKYGFYYSGHRAIMDCLAGVHILSKLLPKSKKTVLSEVLENCKKIKFRLWAKDAPFESKDPLRARGYKWNPDTEDGKFKAWWIELDEAGVVDELEFLWSAIYKRQLKLPMDIINAQARFSILGNHTSQEEKSANNIVVNNIYADAFKRKV